MGEKQKVYGKAVSYEGIFVFKHFFYEMDSWLREHWYDKMEKWNEQQTKPDGTKQVSFEFVPWKKLTDYYKSVIKIELSATNLKDVEIEHAGQKTKAQQGKIEVKFTGYLFVDYRWFYGSKWDKPMMYFIRNLFDNFINLRYTRKYRRVIIDNIDELSSVMMSYLNMEQYKLMRKSDAKKLGYVK